MELILALCMGIGLSSACGYRIFMPPLIINIACHAGYMNLNPDFNWLTSEVAFFVLLIASGLEIGAYYVPWLDNLLDTISVPTSVIAGTILTASFITNTHPLLAWTLSAIVGGGASGLTSASTGLLRLGSTGMTGGLANPIISTVENFLSLILSILSIVLPIIMIVLIVLMPFFAIKVFKKIKLRRIIA